MLLQGSKKLVISITDTDDVDDTTLLSNDMEQAQTLYQNVKSRIWSHFEYEISKCIAVSQEN